MTEQKKTKEPAGKWIEIGHHQVISDENGKVLASIFIGAPTQPKMPIVAVVGNKEIGKYITAAAARAAVNKALGGFDDEHGTLMKSILSRFQRQRDVDADCVVESAPVWTSQGFK